MTEEFRDVDVSETKVPTNTLVAPATSGGASSSSGATVASNDNMFILDTDSLLSGDYDSAPVGAGAGPTKRVSAPPSTARVKPVSDDITLFTVTVTDPETKGDSAMNQFVSYKINTLTKSVSGKVSQSSVYRRYSDFSWLHDTLCILFPGVLVPPLPEKAIVGRFNRHFINERRRALELFVNRMTMHPDLSRSEDLMIFLYADGLTFSEAKLRKVLPPGPDGEKELAKEEKESNSVQSVASSMWNAITTGVDVISSSFTTQTEWPKTQEDAMCDRITAYTNLLEAALMQLHTGIETLIDKHKELSKEWKEVAIPSSMLGRFENKQREVHLGEAFINLGNCCDKVASIIKTTAEHESVHFREHIKDQIRLACAVKELMNSRNAILEQYHEAMGVVEQKEAKLKSAKDQFKDAKTVTDAEKNLYEAQEFATKMKQYLEEVTQKAMTEIAKWRKEKKRDSLHVVKDYVRLQISNAKKLQHSWENLLVELEKEQIPATPQRFGVGNRAMAEAPGSPAAGSGSSASSSSPASGVSSLRAHPEAAPLENEQHQADLGADVEDEVSARLAL